MSLKNKKVLLVITGGIAAYKSIELLRQLIKKEVEVQIILTSSASQFVSLKTLSTLSKRPIFIHFFNKLGQWNNHVALAHWCDFMLIAPCTANTLSKMANGICDNLALATYFSMEKRIFFAPAMDLEMYKHSIIIENIEKLKTIGNIVIPAQFGELASGLIGEGRMMEPVDIIAFLENNLSNNDQDFKNKNILITTGGTQENIDLVRYIGNRSSGKMGFAMAKSALERGAKVTLITAPTKEKLLHNNLSIISVRTAQEMYNEVVKNQKTTDIFIMAAAVSDYTPKIKFDKKLKKEENNLTIELIPTKDILKKVGLEKSKKQIVVGFALESENEMANARKKLISKNADMIVLNAVNNEKSPFENNFNKITIIEKDETNETSVENRKSILADDILNRIKDKL